MAILLGAVPVRWGGLQLYGGIVASSEPRYCGNLQRYVTDSRVVQGGDFLPASTMDAASIFPAWGKFEIRVKLGHKPIRTGSTVLSEKASFLRFSGISLKLCPGELVTKFHTHLQISPITMS